METGHCTGEGWCPKQHPQPGPDDGALPAVGHAAARAALRYGSAQGWILDETARGSVNIQEAVDRVAHAGHAAVALHTRGRHGGPAERIIVEPSGMVLVLAADMVPGVLHASRVRRARPQWTIQVYTPPRAWPFSTRAVLAVMWHLEPEDAPTGTAEEITRDLHTLLAGEDFPWRRPRGGLPVAPAAEGLSVAATLQRHPDKRARHFLQTGTVPAAPPDSEWRWHAGEAQPLPGPWVLPLWYLFMGTLAPATQAVKGAFPQPLLPGVALLRSLQAGAAGVRWREEGGRPSPYFPLVQGQALLHAEPYHTHPERLGAQSFPQPAPPALPPGQSPEALQQGPPLDTATTVQQRGSNGTDGAEPDCTNCGAVAWTAACRHLARDTNGLRGYRPTDRTALASAVAAVTMGPVAAWPAQLLPHVPCQDAQRCRPAATHTPTASLTAEQLYVVAAALLADGGESLVHHHGPAQIAGSIQGPQRDAPHPWHATLCGRTGVRDAGGGTPPPRPQQGEALVLQTASYQAILHGHAGGYRSPVLTGGRWTVWHSTARQGAFPPQPHVDWQQGPTLAYYMSADPWLRAVLLHTVGAPNKRQEPRWVTPPAL